MSAEHPKNRTTDEADRITPFPQEWDTRRLSAEEAEAEHMVSNRRLGPRPVPFGFQNDRWKALLARMVEGDELWEFSTPREDWHALAGRAGIALVRQGRIVDEIITLMS